VEFAGKLASFLSQPTSDALLDFQFYNPNSPEGVQKLGNVFGSLLGKGSMQFSDDTGKVAINPLTGQFELMGKNFGIGINPNQMDPSAQLKFQFGKAAEKPSPPVMMSQFLSEGIKEPSPSAGRQELEQQLERYRSTNPYWYRP
jgi:hypothetical protein